MALREGLADLLGDLPSGPQLAAALAEVDPSALYASELALVTAAWSRMVNHAEAQLMVAARELALTPMGSPDPGTRDAKLDPRSVDSVAPVLAWSRSKTLTCLAVADELVGRLPDVLAALRLGHIDREKAGAFAHQLRDLDDPTAQAVAARYLPKAPGWTYDTLRDRLHAAALRADPTLAQRRHEQALTCRSVYVGTTRAGTGVLEGVNLPAQATVEARNALERLARAAKADGDPRTLMQLRADALLDLVRGIPFRREDPTHSPAPSRDPVTAHADTTYPLPDNEAPLNGETPPGGETMRARGVEDDAVRHDDDLPPTAGQRDPADLPAHLIDHDAGEPPDPRAREWSPNPDPDFDLRHTAAPDAAVAPPWAPPDPDPANPASLADPAGAAELAGAAGAACGECGRIVTPTPRRGTCNIHVDIRTLMRLADDPGLIPGWGHVTADVARHIALDPEAPLRWMLLIHDNQGRPLTQVETRRRPDAAVKAFVKARDKTCRYPGCRHPAVHCDDDHCVDYAKGGPTRRTNLAVLCRAHHAFKHEHGLEYEINSAGTTFWYFPDGRVYIVPPDDLPWYVGNNLDDTPPRQPTHQIIPRKPTTPDQRPVRIGLGPQLEEAPPTGE